MKTSRKEKVILRSMVEFERRYLPKAFEQKSLDQPIDAHSLGINLARESLKEVKKEFIR